MVKQARSKKTDTIGKGKVTPAQIAFIVDRYLSDNNYTQSRSAFRNEASSLIAKSPVNDAPRGLLSLGAILNEYINLKEEKVMMEQERIRLEQEKLRIQTLLQGMQGAMNAYSASPSLLNPSIQASITKSVVTYPQSDPRTASSTGCVATTLNSGRVPQATPSYATTAQPSSSKRKHPTTATGPPSVTKKPRAASCSKRLPVTTNSETVIQSNGSGTCEDQSAAPKPNKNPTNVSLQGSSIAKRLFYQPLPSTPTKSPTTPPQEGSTNNNAQEITPMHCTVMSYEKITVSPFKQMASYTIERSHCISSSPPVKENHPRLVKGRLDFDESQVPVEKDSSDSTLTSESDKDIDIFDLDFVEALGGNLSFSELLVDLDLDSEGIDFSCQSMKETISGLSSMENNHGVSQFVSEHSATVTEILSEEDVQIQGVNNMMAVKSVTRCTSLVSPVKNPGSCIYPENCNREN